MRASCWLRRWRGADRRADCTHRSAMSYRVYNALSMPMRHATKSGWGHGGKAPMTNRAQRRSLFLRSRWRRPVGRRYRPNATRACRLDNSEGAPIPFSAASRRVSPFGRCPVGNHHRLSLLAGRGSARRARGLMGQRHASWLMDGQGTAEPPGVLHTDASCDRDRGRMTHARSSR